MAMSAKMRVIEFEPHLNLDARAAELEQLLSRSLHTHGSWANWYHHSHILVLKRASTEAIKRGITSSNIRRSIAETAPNASQAGLHALIKKRFQSHVLSELLHKEEYCHEHVLRMRLARWALCGMLPGVLGRRTPKRLAEIFSLCAPCVAAVVFRTWLNGWCTKRRFQIRPSECLFACRSCTSEDSIEHDAFCPVVRSFAHSQLALSPHTWQYAFIPVFE